MLGGGLRTRPRAASHERSSGTAPMHPRVYAKDEELGKRDDDFRPKRSPTGTSLAQPWKWRKRRLLGVITFVALIYLLVRNIPTDLGPPVQSDAVPSRPLNQIPGYRGGQEEPSGAPPKPNTYGQDEENKHYYNGPIRFYRLASSLHTIGRTMGAKPLNRNVMFAASSLHSAANLIPMACEMAKWDRNCVHMVLLGRDPLPLADILKINGVDVEECSVYFHDSRADYSEYSSDARAEMAVLGAMKHVNDYMHPQAIIMDDSKVEDKFFTKAMRAKIQELFRVLIEIPAGKYEDFLWMTRLDSGSLSNWFRPNIDILIDVPPGSSGSLTRLIYSLYKADYAGLKVPRLTVEVPSDIEPFASKRLQSLDWPPSKDYSPVKQSTLSIRHRIPNERLSSEQASLRFIESFYPQRTDDHHVLVLSSQAELNAKYLQYLHYVLLEYKYSSYGSPDSENLLGISLDVPSTFLNGSGDFMPPSVAKMRAQRYLDDAKYDQAGLSPFLYQAPSASASLIFGDGWATFHNFLSNRLAATHAGSADKVKKLVSEAEPAWLEYLLELMRARGWSILQPPIPFVTIHNDLAQVPEEFTREKQDTVKHPELSKQLADPEEPFLTAEQPPQVVDHIERETRSMEPLHRLLPFDGDLPELTHLPYLAYTGELTDAPDAYQMQEDFVTLFRQQASDCDKNESTRTRVVHDLRTEDLFCLPGVEVEYALEDEEQTAQQIVEETALVADGDVEEEDVAVGFNKASATNGESLKDQGG